MGFALIFALSIVRLLPLKRIQFLNIIKTLISVKIIQNLVADSVINFICFANARKNELNKIIIESSRRFI